MGRHTQTPRARVGPWEAADSRLSEFRVPSQIRWKFFSTSRREIRSMTGRPWGQTVE